MKSKILITLIMLILGSFLFAEPVKVIGVFCGEKQEFTVQAGETLSQICDKLNIPVKKIKSLLQTELDAYNEANNQDLPNYHRDWDAKTLADLKVTPERFKEVYQKFIDERYEFGGNITIVGISVVFVSLLVICLLIGLFEHIGKERKPKTKSKTVATSVGNVTGDAESMSSNSIVAVIIALHKYRTEIEERRKIMLTFKRTPVSLWGSHNKGDMPNYNFNQPTRGRK